MEQEKTQEVIYNAADAQAFINYIHTIPFVYANPILESFKQHVVTKEIPKAEPKKKKERPFAK